MTRRHSWALLALLSLVLAVGACRRDEPAPEAAPPGDPVAAVEALADALHAQFAEPAFDEIQP